MTFILILTMNISMGTNAQGGIAMHEFNNERACLSAAQKWVKTFYNTKTLRQSYGITYVCVSKG